MKISGLISGKVKKIEAQAKWRFSYKKNVYRLLASKKTELWILHPLIFLRTSQDFGNLSLIFL